MSLTLETAPDALETALDADPRVGVLPFLFQSAPALADVEAAKAYNDRLEAALRDPGVALVAIMVDGRDDGGPRVPALTLLNSVLLCVVESTPKNSTGLTAWQITRRILRVVKRAGAAKGARADIALDNPAYQLGPLGKGTTVYFINLLIRTTEELGTVTP